MVDFDTVESSVSTRDRFKRVSQRDLLPNVVKTRYLGDIVQLSNSSTASTSLSNGEDVTYVITTSTPDSRRLLAVIDLSIYIGSVAAANQLPGGSTVDESAWDVFIGSSNDFGLTDTFNAITLAYIRNVSAGASKTVILNTDSRAIVNTTISG